MSVPRAGVDKAVLALLRASMPAGVLVGDAETPAGVPDVPDHPTEGLMAPYLIVYPIMGGGFAGPIITPDEDATLLYQIATVHRARDKCQDGADRARFVLTARTDAGAYRTPLAPHLVQPAHYTAAGLALGVMGVAPAGSAGAAEPAGSLWRADDQYAVTVTTYPT